MIPRVSLGYPGDLDGFPRRTIARNRVLWRLTRSEHRPWWFSSTMTNRFDLSTPYGTCYLAFDPLDAIVEVLGHDIVDRVVPSSFFDRHVMWRLSPPGTVRAGDVTASAAFAFGVTAEISTLVPYTLSQRWAEAIRMVGLDGVYFDMRHSPAFAPALALFGEDGFRSGWDDGTSAEIGSRLVSRLEATFGLEVLPIPSSGELRII